MDELCEATSDLLTSLNESRRMHPTSTVEVDRFATGVTGLPHLAFDALTWLNPSAFPEMPSQTPRQSEECWDYYGSTRATLEQRDRSSHYPLFSTMQNYEKSDLQLLKLLSTNQIRKRLQTLYECLHQQLLDCGNPHTLRLKLNGFYYDEKHYLNDCFEYYISQGHEPLSARWLCGRAIAARTAIGEPREAGWLCEVITDCVEKDGELAFAFFDNSSRTLPHAVGGNVIHLDANHDPPPKTRLAPTKPLWKLTAPTPANEYDRWNINNNENDLLCFKLALSMSFLSSRQWRQLYWGSTEENDEGVYFLVHEATQLVAKTTDAFISLKLSQTASGCHEWTTSGNTQLVQFATLLLQVHDKKIPELLTDVPELAEEDLKQALVVSLKEDRSRGESDFVAATMACLEGVPTNTSERGFLKYILERVVLPLFRASGLQVKDIVAKLPSRQEYTKEVIEMAESSTPGQHSHAAELYRDDLAVFNREHVERADPDDSPKRRMRIAVLDSGVSSTDRFIKKHFEAGTIVEGRNFTSGPVDDYEDDVGHGTLVTHVLAQAAPEAAIYVAKVARSRALKFSDLGAIARAINFAINFWDIDIINISMSIYDYHPDIKDALRGAISPGFGKKCRIVLVAAGGNHGGLDRPSWLAKIRGVIPIHAVDGYGDPHGRAPGPDGPRESFGALGFDINLPKQSEQGMGRVYVTGTSYATPVAAAIAAGIMEFVHKEIINHPNQRYKDYGGALHNPHYIQAVFRCFSTMTNGRLFLQPWRSCQDIYRADTPEYSWLPRNHHRNLFKVLEQKLLDM